MTILGTIADRDRAWVWSDSEIYSLPSGKPTGTLSKLAVNALAPLVAVSAGISVLAEEAEALALRAASFDDALDGMPAHLRRACLRTAPRWHPAAAMGFAYQTTVLVGWSENWQRMVAATFRGATLFSEELVGRFSLPHVEAFDRLAPRRAEDLIACAREQFALIPSALGGRLVVAEVTRAGITARPICDLSPSIAAEIGCAPQLSCSELS